MVNDDNDYDDQPDPTTTNKMPDCRDAGNANEMKEDTTMTDLNSQQALALYDARFHVFDWETVSRAAEQAMLNRCASLGRQTETFRASVRQATEIVRELTNALSGE